MLERWQYRSFWREYRPLPFVNGQHFQTDPLPHVQLVYSSDVTTSAAVPSNLFAWLLTLAFVFLAGFDSAITVLCRGVRLPKARFELSACWRVHNGCMIISSGQSDAWKFAHGEVMNNK